MPYDELLTSVETRTHKQFDHHETSQNFDHAISGPYDEYTLMAILQDRQTNARYTLLSDHLVGRGPTCNLQLSDPDISSVHAQVRWTGYGWEVRDLASHNGTWVDDQKLLQSEYLPLSIGTRIGFGRPDVAFTLVDDSAPVAHAVGARGRRCEAEGDFFILPDSESYAYTVFQADHGAWCVEDSRTGERATVANRQVLSTKEDTWTLHLPQVIPRTRGRDSRILSLAELTLRFEVDTTSRHISATLVHSDGQIDLAPRVHLRMLLHLAQRRLADRDRVSAREEGWTTVDELIDELDPGGHGALWRPQIDTWVFNARRQLRDADVRGAMDIVQRRTTTETRQDRRRNQIRTGIGRLEIRSL